MLAVVFIYILFGILRSLLIGDNGIDIWILRIGIVIFILCIYAISYTEMFKEYYEYWLSLLMIINSANLLCMGIIIEGLPIIIESPFSMMPYALIMIVINYVFPMRYQIAVISGVLVSVPYFALSLYIGSLGYIMTTFMLLVVLNILLSFNTYSNEKMMKKLYNNK